MDPKDPKGSPSVAPAKPPAITTTASSVVRKQKHPLWQQLALGGSSCAVATTFTHPIDTVKLRLQLQGAFSTGAAPQYNGLVSGLYHVSKHEGIPSLYYGISPAILRAATYSATRLGMYEPLRTFFTEAFPSTSKPTDAYQPGQPTSAAEPTFVIKVAAAVSSGALGAFVGNPCELIKVRMQQGENFGYRNVFDGIHRIIRDEGFTSLWIGTYPAAVRAALLTSSQLATYDQTKGLLKRYCGLKEGLQTHVGAAMTAGLITTTMSTPADVVKSVVMNSQPRIHPIECARKILQREGVAGFMRGWTANYARLGPHTLITVITFENLRTALGWKNL